jgi:DNA-binding NarL/FixJ family response regulator
MVVDVALPVLSGIEAARQLKSIHPEGKIVFMSIHRAPAIVQEALSSGALGYVLKTSAADDLADAIRAALEGRSFISPALKP